MNNKTKDILDEVLDVVRINDWGLLKKLNALDTSR